MEEVGTEVGGDCEVEGGEGLQVVPVCKGRDAAERPEGYLEGEGC